MTNEPSPTPVEGARDEWRLTLCGTSDISLRDVVAALLAIDPTLRFHAVVAPTPTPSEGGEA